MSTSEPGASDAPKSLLPIPGVNDFGRNRQSALLRQLPNSSRQMFRIDRGLSSGTPYGTT